RRRRAHRPDHFLADTPSALGDALRGLAWRPTGADSGDLGTGVRRSARFVDPRAPGRADRSGGVASRMTARRYALTDQRTVRFHRRLPCRTSSSVLGLSLAE